jgi:hypothetical protein
MRNEVHLRAEILIEQVHQINDSMIAEIDQYEKECVESFNSKNSDYSKECGRLLAKTNDFYKSTSKYMNEFKVDKNIVKESLANANEFIIKLNKENDLCEKLKFNERAIQFVKSSFEFEKKLYGSFYNKRLTVKELKLDKYKGHETFVFFEQDNYSQKIVFNVDAESNLINIDLIDLNEEIEKEFPNLLIANDLFISQTSENYIISACLICDADSIFGRPITRHDNDNNILIMIDNKLNYLKHKEIDYSVMLVTSNDSNTICIDWSDNFYYYDNNFEFVADKPLIKIEKEAEFYFGDILMNNSHLFILCCSDKRKIVKIFDLNVFGLVKHIDVEADSMKLLSTSHLILFDSKSKILHLYNQSGDFELQDQIDLTQFLDGNEIYLMSADKSSTILFHDRPRAKFIYFSQLFTIPGI